MKKWATELAARPTRYIEGILAAVLIIFTASTLTLSHFGFGTSDSPLSIRIILSVIYIILVAPTIGSYFIKNKKRKYKFRKIGINALISAFAFIVILRITAIGLVPVIWVYPLAMIFVLGVCWICAEAEREKHGG